MTENNIPHILPIQGAFNVRDLGGYPGTDGKTTKFDVFFRADSTDRLTEQDVNMLLEHGVKLVIDLRSGEEVLAKPSVFADRTDVAYHNIQIIDNINSEFGVDNFPKSMGELYIRLLNYAKGSIMKIFTLFYQSLSTAGGACLFHCTAGKDRTGTISMLLLNLAGVADELIVEDYARTDELIKELRELQMAAFRAQNIPVPEFALRAYPENMQEALQHLHTAYTDAAHYLLDCGINQEEIDFIRSSFI